MFWVILGGAVFMLGVVVFLNGCLPYGSWGCILSGLGLITLGLLLGAFGTGAFNDFDWSVIGDFFKPMEPKEIEPVVCDCPHCK